MTGTTADTQWKFSATYVVLPNENVDTDQIIPARFLTTTDRAGLGPNAFNDWRYLADGSPNPDFVLNKPESKGARGARRGTQLRLRLVARARRVGARRRGVPRRGELARSPTSSAATRSATACCRSRCRPRCWRS